MSREEILKIIKTAFDEVFDMDGVVYSEELTQDDVEDWDSVGHIYLTVKLDELFNSELDEEMMDVSDVGGIADLVEKKLGGK